MWLFVAQAFAVSCDDVQNMVALNLPAEVVRREDDPPDDPLRLVATCPEAAAVQKRRVLREASRLSPPLPTPYRPLPPWVRPGVEIVPAR